MIHHLASVHTTDDEGTDDIREAIEAKGLLDRIAGRTGRVGEGMTLVMVDDLKRIEGIDRRFIGQALIP